jgi:hypothetical protein
MQSLRGWGRRAARRPRSPQPADAPDLAADRGRAAGREEVFEMKEFTEDERVLLIDLLNSALDQKLHELHHTSTLAYKQLLKRHVDTIEGMIVKLTSAAAATG